MTTASPLQWPAGWRRLPAALRTRAKFNRKEWQAATIPGNGGWNRTKELSVADATARVLRELERFGVQHGDAIISTNLALRLDGLPRSNQGEPADPGAAVYWRLPGEDMKVMAVDRYDRVADNLAAIAATLEAMRAIERHGGAEILKRTFTGFAALAAPKDAYAILGLQPGATREDVEAAWKQEARKAHPDTGGSHARMAEVNAARDAIIKLLEASHG